MLPLLLACVSSTPHTTSQPAARPDAEIRENSQYPYVPTLDPDFPADLQPMSWKIMEGVPDLVQQQIQETQEEWSSALVCGKQMQRVEQTRDADVIWDCGDFGVPDVSGKVGYERVSDKLVISIFTSVCNNPSAGVPRHAWGHALGFKHDARYYTTTMDGGEMAHPDDSNDAMEQAEIDGFQRWAIENGATGCEQ